MSSSDRGIVDFVGPTSLVIETRIDPELRAAFRGLVSHDFSDLDAARLRSLERPIAARPVDSASTVRVSVHSLETGDGSSISVRFYTDAARAPRGVLVWAHGGGYVLGRAEQDDGVLRALTSETGCAVLAPDYRLAPEHPFPKPLEDIHTCLLAARTSEFGLGSDIPLLVGGSSAGGGLAAAAVLMAAERKEVHIAMQILVAPMIDDRNVPADDRSEPDPHVWSRPHNLFGWSAYLGRAFGTEVSPLAAASRTTDFRGVCPTFIAVGDVDIFAVENIRYAANAAAAGVPVELHVYRGAFHGFATVAPQATVSRHFVESRNRAITKLFDGWGAEDAGC